MTNAPIAREQWPAWAKALLITISLLAVISILPWVFMVSAMAGICAPMFGNMPHGNEMMR
jgi:hypothetical protein